MDRELAAGVQRKRKVSQYSRFILAGLLLVLTLAAFRLLLKPAISRADIRTSVAAVGSIEAALTASGITVPETEEIITSSIPARIEKVFRRPGEKIAAGESVLQLDKASILTSYNKLKDEQLIKQNKNSKLRIQLQKDLNDLQAQHAIKKMQVKRLTSVVADEQYLLKIGGGTAENAKQAELNLQVAQMELELLSSQIRNKKLAMAADLKELGYELNSQDRDIRELERTINQAEVKAGHKGVVTYVNTDIGASVNKNDVLAKVADLSSFKVKANISDSYADQLQPGGAVIVRINETDLRGIIATIEPVVTNGIITFFVQLDQKDHALLRPNLRVDVFVVTAFKKNVVRVKNGPFYNGAHNQPVFVLQGDKAVRRMVEIGDSNFDFVELKTEVAPGESVIISDMKAYENLAEIKLKD